MLFGIGINSCLKYKSELVITFLLSNFGSLLLLCEYTLHAI